MREFKKGDRVRCIDIDKFPHKGMALHLHSVHTITDTQEDGHTNRKFIILDNGYGYKVSRFVSASQLPDELFKI